MKALLQKSISDVKSDLIDALIEVHNQAQSWQTKRQILHFAYHSFSVCLRGGVSWAHLELTGPLLSRLYQHYLLEAQNLFLYH